MMGVTEETDGYMSVDAGELDLLAEFQKCKMARDQSIVDTYKEYRRQSSDMGVDASDRTIIIKIASVMEMSESMIYKILRSAGVLTTQVGCGSRRRVKD